MTIQMPAGAGILPRRSVHGHIVEELGRNIVAGAFPPGSVLPTEGNYSARLSVSRTAFREAVKLLAGKGLVESRPRTGTRVRPRNAWNMLDPDVTSWAFRSSGNRAYARAFFEFRQIVEPAAAERAATRRSAEDLRHMREALEGMRRAGSRDEWIGPDLAFHQAILEATGNDLLRSLGRLLEPALTRSFAIANVDARRRRASVPLHEAILLGIERADADGARQAMEVLLEEALIDLEEMIESDGPDKE